METRSVFIACITK